MQTKLEQLLFAFGRLLLVPLACLSYFFGWLLYVSIYCAGFCCCPILGPAFFLALAEQTLCKMDPGGPGEAGGRLREQLA